MHQSIHDSNKARHLGRGHKAGENEVLGNAGNTRHLLESFPPIALADEEKLQARTGLHQVRSNREQIIVTFEVHQARDFRPGPRPAALGVQAPRAGLEPATNRLHRIPPFPAGVDYLITMGRLRPVGGGRSRGDYPSVTP